MTEEQELKNKEDSSSKFQGSPELLKAKKQKSGKNWKPLIN